MIDTETVAAAFDRFLAGPGRSHSTKQKYRYKFRLFLDRYGHMLVEQVSLSLLEEWFDYMENRLGYSQGHLAFHHSCHVTFWGWSFNQRGLANPAKELSRYSQKARQFIAADGDNIKTALIYCERNMWTSLRDQRDAAIFALGSCGLRRSNVGGARCSDLRHALDRDGSIYILRVGGKEPMEAVLDERRALILRRWLRNRPETAHDRLFISLSPGPSYLLPLTEVGLGRARRRVCRLANVPAMTFQQMRRWLGVCLAREYGPLVAAEALGHKSGVDVVIDHYYNPQVEVARQAVLSAIDTS